MVDGAEVAGVGGRGGVAPRERRCEEASIWERELRRERERGASE